MEKISLIPNYLSFYNKVSFIMIGTIHLKYFLYAEFIDNVSVSGILFQLIILPMYIVTNGVVWLNSFIQINKQTILMLSSSLTL